MSFAERPFDNLPIELTITSQDGSLDKTRYSPGHESYVGFERMFNLFSDYHWLMEECFHREIFAGPSAQELESILLAEEGKNLAAFYIDMEPLAGGEMVVRGSVEMVVRGIDRGDGGNCELSGTIGGVRATVIYNVHTRCGNIK